MKKLSYESYSIVLDVPPGRSRSVVFSGSRANPARRATREPGDAVWMATPWGAWRRAARPAKDSTADASEALVSVWRTSAAVVGVRQLGIAAWAGPARPPDRGSEDSERGSVVDAVA